MKREFLFVMVSAGGNVPAQLSVARRLALRGHSVHVLSDPATEPEVAAAGCKFLPFVRAPQHNSRDPVQDLIRDYELRSPLARLRRVGETVLFGPAEAYAKDTLAAIERVGPDAIAVDCMLFGAAVGAEKSGIPAALLFHFIYHAPIAGVTPFGLGLHPAKGRLGMLRDRVITALTKLLFRSGLAPVNAARANLGLPPLRQVFDQFQRLNLQLVLTTREFDFVAPSLPDRVRYVGPQLDDPAWTKPWTSPWRDDDPRPLVVVSLGTTEQRQQPVFHRVIDALGRLPVRGLVTLGGPCKPGDFAPPANVHVVDSAPHGQVLPLASAVVCHGGHGTVMKALAHGLPLVSIPFGRDQLDNTTRVTVHGAGLGVRPNARASALCAAIERVLGDADLRKGAMRQRAAIERDRREDPAVRELEALAARAFGRSSDDLSRDRRVADLAIDGEEEGFAQDQREHGVAFEREEHRT